MMTDEPKTEEGPKEQAPQASIGISPDGTLLVSLPLAVLNRTFARGILLDADDHVKRWYHEREKAREKLRQGGLSHAMRNGLAKIGKLIP